MFVVRYFPRPCGLVERTSSMHERRRYSPATTHFIVLEYMYTPARVIFTVTVAICQGSFPHQCRSLCRYLATIVVVVFGMIICYQSGFLRAVIAMQMTVVNVPAARSLAEIVTLQRGSREACRNKCTYADG